MAPELKAADKQLGGQVQFLKVNIDENLRLLFRYMIVGIPTLLFSVMESWSIARRGSRMPMQSSNGLNRF